MAGRDPRAPRARALSSGAQHGSILYARNLLVYGYLDPHGLPIHSVMFEMPPGSHSLADYLCVPLAAFGPAQASDAPLLHPVWGSLWVSVWFDSHRHFLPVRAAGLGLAAHTLLVLGLVPAFAFAVGLVRGAPSSRGAGPIASGWERPPSSSGASSSSPGGTHGLPA